MKEADLDALVAGETAIVFLDARLIDGIADEPLDRGFVRVREGRVAEAGPMSDYRKAGGDERVVDLAGQHPASRSHRLPRAFCLQRVPQPGGDRPLSGGDGGDEWRSSMAG